MAITVVFDPPLPTDPPSTFDSKAFTLLGDLNDWSTQANAVANQINGAQPNLDIVAGNIANINAAVADLPALSAKVSKTGDTMTGNLNVPSINGGQLAGMRNKIINGAFGINQRGYVSGAATTAGQYTLDRWKVTGTGGVTFSTTNNKTTVTIPSGQTLQQVIEGLNLQTGTYVLSWEGTAQGRIAGGSYSVSGSVTASITGGTNTTIEFNSGTVANVQLELGTIATPFEHRPYGAELALCQWYCKRLGTPTASFAVYGVAMATSSTAAICTIPCLLRASPTFTFSGLQFSGGGVWGVSGLSVQGFLPGYGISLSIDLAGASASGTGFFQQNNTSGAFLQMDAEL